MNVFLVVLAIAIWVVGFLVPKIIRYIFVNNTGISRVIAPAEPRYDVKEKVEHALCVS